MGSLPDSQFTGNSAVQCYGKCLIYLSKMMRLLWFTKLNFQILLIQIKCFHEIITIGYIVYKSHELPWFRTLSWYFLITSNYFFYGESMMQYFGVLMSRTVSVFPGSQHLYFASLSHQQFVTHGRRC